MARTSTILVSACVLVLAVSCTPADVDEPAGPEQDATPEDAGEGDEGSLAAGLDIDPESIVRLNGITIGDDYDEGEDEVETWTDELPDIEEVTITSTADGSDQPSLYLPPSGDGDQPLLVVVHSWSATYTQPLDVPYGQWASEAGWGMIHPDFRGVNETPEATGSDLAVQDVVDAIDDAIDRGGIDPGRVYVTGFSGGGMMSLLLAGRHPDRIAGAVSWVPVEDVNEWYAYKLDDEEDDEEYTDQIEASCGGDPSTDPEAEEDCAARSPSSYLAAARDAGVPIYVGHGIDDTNVPPDHGVRAFDALADEDDALGAEVEAQAATGEWPEDLLGEVEAATGFTDQEPDVLFARSSAAVTFVLFDGEHDLVYHPGLAFLVAVDEAR